MKEDLLESLATDPERAIERQWIEVAERRLAEVGSGAVSRFRERKSTSA
jgi:hypothetical protein